MPIPTTKMTKAIIIDRFVRDAGLGGLASTFNGFLTMIMQCMSQLLMRVPTITYKII